MTGTFDPVTHIYSQNGRDTPSVTQIMRALGIYNPFYAKDEHRRRGKAVHLGVQYVNSGEYDAESTHPLIDAYVQSYIAFVNDTGYQSCMKGEVALFCHSYAGTPDDWGMARNRLWLIDAKSGSEPPMVGVQLAAYKMLLYAQPEKICIESCKAVVLNGTGKGRPYTLKTYDEPKYMEAWRGALALYHLAKEEGVLKT